MILERVQRAHALAREGLQETRRAVGALRGEAVAVPDAIRSLVEEYDGHASLAIADPAGRDRRWIRSTGHARAGTEPGRNGERRSHRGRLAGRAAAAHAGGWRVSIRVLVADDQALVREA